jgi:hypothetical protein
MAKPWTSLDIGWHGDFLDAIHVFVELAQFMLVNMTKLLMT